MVAGQAFPAPQNASVWGQEVVGIELQSDAALSLDDFHSQIVQEVGEPLDPAKVAESLKNLYATGRFQDLRAEAKPLENGVALIFVARAQYFAGTVRVEGNPDGLDAQSLASATHLRLGQPLTNRDLQEADRHLSAVLSENAYYQAKITHRILPDPNTQEGAVVFSITPGKPALLSSLEFKGQTLVPPQKLASIAGWSRGHQLTSAKMEKGLSRLRHFFVKQKRLQAMINTIGRNYDPKHNTEGLVVQVDAGPVVQVRVRGGNVPSSKKKELLPMYSEGVTDDFAVQQGRQNLEDYLQQKGYDEASVKSERTVNSSTQEVDITYTVNPGPLGMFTGYAFEGNRRLSTDELESLLTIQPAGFFHDRGVFSRRMIEADTKSLTDLYRSRGFLEAKITPHVETEHNNQPDHLFVTFAVDEGVQTKVAHLTMEGLDEKTDQDVQSILLTRPGQPYSPERMEKDRESLRTYFDDRGYVRATVEARSTPGPAEHTMNLSYRIALGPQEHIGQITLIGNHHTRSGIIWREMKFHPGEPLSQTNLLDSQRALYDLGLFNQVQIAPQNPQGPPGAKNVLVSVDEAKRWTLGYGGGAEVQRLGSNQPQGEFKASPRFSFDLSRLNVGGRAQTITFSGRLSTLDKGASLSYYIPRFPTRPDLHLRLNALIDRSSDVLTFTSKREEASINFEKRWSRTTLIVGRFNFRNVKALDISNRISVEQIPLVSRSARIAMVGVTYINDHRDNPVDATRGSFSVADGGVSWSGFGSEANFIRVSGENSTYYRLARHLIFARDSRFAVESPYGALRSVTTTDANGMTQIILTHDIPLPERFFMGGSESHRGFSINQAGPRDLETGYPIGGNALFLNSLELRMPFANNRVGFVLFHDAGNVYSSIRRMRLLKIHQSSARDFDYTVHAVGFGFRYKTPVGPLRLDIGYSLNPPRYQVLNQSTGSLEVLRLAHFQYFLGIGQSF
jgi:outer membrane protein insertion porin family